MKSFSHGYILWVPILFGLLYWEFSPLAEPINAFQLNIILYFLDMGLPEGQLRGIDIWINPHYKVIITKACNGIIPYLILSASILAYPLKMTVLLSWGHKLLWIVISYIAMTTLNIGRLCIVAHFVREQSDFPLVHDVFGNLLFMVVGLLLLYLFIRTGKRT